MLRTLNHWGTDVAGLQEVQPDQRRAIARLSQGEYQMYPPAGSRGDNRVLWRTSTFTLLDTTSFSIPYFNGHQSPIPVVLLQQRSTGRNAWFASVHNPAETSRYHHQGVYRARAIAAERAFARRTASRAVPLFILGDLNAKSSAFCPMARGGLLHSASGGNIIGGLSPAGAAADRLDLRHPGARFTGYQVINCQPQTHQRPPDRDHSGPHGHAFVIASTRGRLHPLGSSRMARLARGSTLWHGSKALRRRASLPDAVGKAQGCVRTERQALQTALLR